MKCIILAAGFGTRLASLYPNTPKALVPVAGKPIIEHILENVAEVQEIDTIYIVTNAVFYEQFTKWQKNVSYEKPIKILNDGVKNNEERMGSIGGIIFALEKGNIRDDVLVLGSDNILGFKLSDFVAEFKKSRHPSIAAYDVKDKVLASQYGIIEIDEQNKIIAFEEKPAHPKSTLASTLAYLLPKESLHLLQKYRGYGLRLDRAGDYIAWLAKQQDVRAFVFTGIWFDIGTPEQLKHADQVLSKANGNNKGPGTYK